MTLQTSTKNISTNSRSGMIVLLRSIGTGFLICFLGIFFWTTEYSILPLPYSIFFIIIFLAFYCYYLSGKGWPAKTAAFRRESFRSLNLPISTWLIGLTCAVLFVIIVESSLVLTFRLIPFPEKAFKSQYPVFDTLPHGMAWALVCCSALVAGVCEETGFRGYLQAPLEKRFGAFWAILISSMLFMLVHLSKAWAGGIVPQIFFAGILFGILAYKTGSLIPGIIAHTLLDVINFSYWWSHLAGNFSQKPIFQTGVDASFMFWSILFVVSLIGFLWLILKTKPALANSKGISKS